MRYWKSTRLHYYSYKLYDPIYLIPFPFQRAMKALHRKNLRQSMIGHGQNSSYFKAFLYNHILQSFIYSLKFHNFSQPTKNRFNCSKLPQPARNQKQIVISSKQPKASPVHIHVTIYNLLLNRHPLTFHQPLPAITDDGLMEFGPSITSLYLLIVG